MAGFLTHIAARLGESEKMLRPRLPSLFEPAPTVALDPTVAGGFRAGEHPIARALERGDEIDPPIATNAQSASDRLSPSQDRSAGTLLVTPESISTDRRPYLEPSATRNDPVTSADPRDSRRQAAARPHTRTFSDRPADATRDAPASKDAGSAIRPADIVAGSRMAPPRHVQPVDAGEQADALRTRVATSATRTAPDSRQGALEPIREPTSAASGILQAPVVARIVSEPLFSAPRTPESEPTVHVTIGRVEVRAVASSAADSRRGERLPSPVMSLDEYLRTRAR